MGSSYKYTGRAVGSFEHRIIEAIGDLAPQGEFTRSDVASKMDSKTAADVARAIERFVDAGLLSRRETGQTGRNASKFAYRRTRQGQHLLKGMATKGRWPVAV